MHIRRSILAMLAALILFTGCANAQEPSHIKDVVYAHKLGVALTMDVFKPAKPNGIGVIWMVSGGWVSNYDNINPAWAKVFTDRGQTVFDVVHGSQPRFFLPEIIQDIHRSVRFIRTHAKEYGVNPDRLGISGGSAGGHLSLMMGSYGGPGNPNARDPVERASSEVEAAACFFPPTDFLNYGAEGKISLDEPMLKPYHHVFAIPDTASKEDKEKGLRPLSPIYGISKKTPPTLIIHGEADTLVPIQQSERYLARLKEEGVETKLVRRPDKGHGWPGIEQDLALLADWFDSHLGRH